LGFTLEKHFLKQKLFKWFKCDFNVISDHVIIWLMWSNWIIFTSSLQYHTLLYIIVSSSSAYWVTNYIKSH
jgi:hypothetical protein